MQVRLTKVSKILVSPLFLLFRTICGLFLLFRTDYLGECSCRWLITAQDFDVSETFFLREAAIARRASGEALSPLDYYHAHVDI